MNRPWHLYVVRCADGTLYTGVGVDVALRVHAHNHRESGAEYTRSRRPVVLVASALVGDQGDALRAERAFKRLSRTVKLGHVVAGTLAKFVRGFRRCS